MPQLLSGLREQEGHSGSPSSLLDVTYPPVFTPLPRRGPLGTSPSGIQGSSPRSNWSIIAGLETTSPVHWKWKNAGFRVSSGVNLSPFAVWGKSKHTGNPRGGRKDCSEMLCYLILEDEGIVTDQIWGSDKESVPLV